MYICICMGQNIKYIERSVQSGVKIIINLNLARVNSLLKGAKYGKKNMGVILAFLLPSYGNLGKVVRWKYNVHNA